jgi:hypothetical protein
LRARRRRAEVKQDPGIPNLWPFKEALLDQITRQREKISAEQVRQRAAIALPRPKSPPRAATAEGCAA